MITAIKHPISPTAIVLGLVLVTVSSPSLARMDEQQITFARESALRECNAEVAKLYTRLWTEHQILRYRVCMERHGEPE
jgi:hypothetical protein